MKKALLTLALLASGLLSSHAQGGTKMEAENAAYSNCKLISDSKYSGGKALEITEENAKITFTFNASERGKYKINVGYDGLYGAKVVKKVDFHPEKVFYGFRFVQIMLKIWWFG